MDEEIFVPLDTNSIIICSRPKDPVDVYLDLDNSFNVGIKSFHVTIEGKEIVFTKQEIEKYLMQIKKGLENAQ